MKHGAGGAIVVHTTPSASYPWSVVQHNGVEEHFALDLPGSGFQVDLLGWLDEETSGTVAARMGTTVPGLFEMAKERDFEPVDTGYRVSATIETDVCHITTANVVGMLEGSDPALEDQVVVFRTLRPSGHERHTRGRRQDLQRRPGTTGREPPRSSAGRSIRRDEPGAGALDPLSGMCCGGEGVAREQLVRRQASLRTQPLVANLNVDMPQIFGVTSDISAIRCRDQHAGRRSAREGESRRHHRNRRHPAACRQLLPLGPGQLRQGRDTGAVHQPRSDLTSSRSTSTRMRTGNPTITRSATRSPRSGTSRGWSATCGSSTTRPCPSPTLRHATLDRGQRVRGRVAGPTRGVALPEKRPRRRRHSPPPGARMCGPDSVRRAPRPGRKGRERR